MGTSHCPLISIVPQGSSGNPGLSPVCAFCPDIMHREEDKRGKQDAIVAQDSAELKHWNRGWEVFHPIDPCKLLRPDFRTTETKIRRLQGLIK
jgi:hypothetical protein